jgi:hypothetical protein
MSFMTGIIFSWILIVIILTVYELASIDNSNIDVVYMMNREKRQRQQGDDDISRVMFVYTAVIAAIVLPQMNQID